MQSENNLVINDDKLSTFENVYNNLYEGENTCDLIDDSANILSSSFLTVSQRSQLPDQSNPESRQKAQRFFDQAVSIAAMQAAEVEPHAVVPGDVISAIQAVNHEDGQSNCDIRPYFFDKLSNSSYLLDSGSFVTTTCRSPEDVLHPEVVLKRNVLL